MEIRQRTLWNFPGEQGWMSRAPHRGASIRGCTWAAGLDRCNVVVLFVPKELSAMVFSACGHNPRWTFLARSIQRTVSRLPVARPCTRASPSVSRCMAPRSAPRSVPSLNLIIFRALGLQWPVRAVRCWRDQAIQRWAWQYPPGGRG